MIFCCIYKHIVIHSTLDEHAGCFPVVATVEAAAGNEGDLGLLAHTQPREEAPLRSRSAPEHPCPLTLWDFAWGPPSAPNAGLTSSHLTQVLPLWWLSAHAGQWPRDRDGAGGPQPSQPAWVQSTHFEPVLSADWGHLPGTRYGCSED